MVNHTVSSVRAICELMEEEWQKNSRRWNVPYIVDKEVKDALNNPADKRNINVKLLEQLELMSEKSCELLSLEPKLRGVMEEEIIFAVRRFLTLANGNKSFETEGFKKIFYNSHTRHTIPDYVERCFEAVVSWEHMKEKKVMMNLLLHFCLQFPTGFPFLNKYDMIERNLPYNNIDDKKNEEAGQSTSLDNRVIKKEPIQPKMEVDGEYAEQVYAEGVLAMQEAEAHINMPNAAVKMEPLDEEEPTFENVAFDQREIKQEPPNEIEPINEIEPVNEIKQEPINEDDAAHQEEQQFMHVELCDQQP